MEGKVTEKVIIIQTMYKINIVQDSFSKSVPPSSIKHTWCEMSIFLPVFQDPPLMCLLHCFLSFIFLNSLFISLLSYFVPSFLSIFLSFGLSFFIIYFLISLFISLVFITYLSFFSIYLLICLSFFSIYYLFVFYP